MVLIPLHYKNQKQENPHFPCHQNLSEFPSTLLVFLAITTEKTAVFIVTAEIIKLGGGGGGHGKVRI
jgi:hypothetical protein